MYQTILEEDSPKGKVAKQLWKDVRNVSRSGNAIARIVHESHGRRWSDDSDLALLDAFKAADAGAPNGYRLGTTKERTAIIQNVAIKTKRSPAAIKIRLGILGVDLSRIKAEVKQEDVKRVISAAVSRYTA